MHKITYIQISGMLYDAHRRIAENKSFAANSLIFLMNGGIIEGKL